jgi:hypothetical protein
MAAMRGDDGDTVTYKLEQQQQQDHAQSTKYVGRLWVRARGRQSIRPLCTGRGCVYWQEGCVRAAESA